MLDLARFSRQIRFTLALRLKVMQINVLDAINRLAELLKAAQPGRELTIARRAVPSARLLPVTKIDIEPLSSYQRLAAWHQAHPDPIGPSRSGAEIDLAIGAERDA